MLASDAEHDLQVRAGVDLRSHRLGHPGEELGRLVRTRCHPQGVQREAGVADPGVPVVPVPLATHGFGQRGGGGGDDRTGRLIHEGLQDQTAVIDEVTPRAFVALMRRRPRPPGTDGALDLPCYLGLGPHPGSLLLDRAVMEGEAGSLAGAQSEAHAGGRSLDGDWGGGREDEDIGASSSRHAPFHRPEERFDQPELWPWRVFHLELEPAVRASHHAKKRAGGTRPEVVALLVLVEGHGLHQESGSRLGSEGRLEHHRVSEVPASDIRLVRGGDRPVPGVFVENPREHRRLVEPREAEPLDRALPADERARVAVGEQGEVGDWCVAHVCSPFSVACPVSVRWVRSVVRRSFWQSVHACIANHGRRRVAPTKPEGEP